jgi:hypothetical protein
MEEQKQKLIHALLAIPFVQRTEDKIQSELEYQVWAMHRLGHLETNHLDPAIQAEIKSAVPMPSEADVYNFFLDAVKANLATINPYTKPTLLEVCRAVDDEMQTFPFSSGAKKALKYEIVRTKIINEIDCADDICVACGGIVEETHWGGTYCSHHCWSRADND